VKSSQEERRGKARETVFLKKIILINSIKESNHANPSRAWSPLKDLIAKERANFSKVQREIRELWKSVIKEAPYFFKVLQRHTSTLEKFKRVT